MSPVVSKRANRMDSLGEYFFSRANKKIAQIANSGKEIINLGIGSPDLPPSPLVIEELAKRSRDLTLHGYPSYSGLPLLRTEIMRWYEKEFGVHINSVNMILPISGSKEGLVFTTLAFVNPGDEVLIPNPGFSTYKHAALLAGATPRLYSIDFGNEYQPDFEMLEKTDLSKVKLMWVNYPHNPTGATASLKQLEKIVSFGKKHSILIASDNPYSHISFNKPHETSILEVHGALDIAIEVNSLSKAYNMAGWRIGWIVGNRKLISTICALYSNIETGVFIPVQYAAIKALQLPQSFITERNEIYKRRLTIVNNIAEILGCEISETKASLYVWAKLPKHILNAENYCFDLAEKTGIFITPGTAFGSGGEGYVRISLCKPEHILLEAKLKLEKYLQHRP